MTKIKKTKKINKYRNRKSESEINHMKINSTNSQSLVRKQKASGGKRYRLKSCIKIHKVNYVYES